MILLCVFGSLLADIATFGQAAKDGDDKVVFRLSLTPPLFLPALIPTDFFRAETEDVYVLNCGLFCADLLLATFAYTTDGSRWRIEFCTRLSTPVVVNKVAFTGVRRLIEEKLASVLKLAGFVIREATEDL